MINFSQFLSEARLAPLYHATKHGKSILAENIIRVGSHPEPGLDVKTVSLTRDFNFARNWLKEYSVFDTSKGIIFELDQQKLAQNYKIVPYNYFGNDSWAKVNSARKYPTSRTFTKGLDFEFENQFEEAVTKDIKNARRYITKVYVYADSEAGIPDYLKHENIPIYSYYNKKELRK